MRLCVVKGRAVLQLLTVGTRVDVFFSFLLLLQLWGGTVGDQPQWSLHPTSLVPSCVLGVCAMHPYRWDHTGPRTHVLQGPGHALRIGRV